MEDAREVIRAWLVEPLWEGDTAEARQPVVDCIMAQDGWRFARQRLDLLRSEGFTDPEARELLHGLLTMLYDHHSGPHLETCPKYPQGSRRPAQAGSANRKGIRGGICYTEGCEKTATGLSRWERDEPNKYRCSTCKGDITRLAPGYSDDAGMSLDEYRALVEDVLRLHKVRLCRKLCERCGSPFTLTNLPRLTAGANSFPCNAVICSNHYGVS